MSLYKPRVFFFFFLSALVELGDLGDAAQSDPELLPVVAHCIGTHGGTGWDFLFSVDPGCKSLGVTVLNSHPVG